MFAMLNCNWVDGTELVGSSVEYRLINWLSIRFLDEWSSGKINKIKEESSEQLMESVVLREDCDGGESPSRKVSQDRPRLDKCQSTPTYEMIDGSGAFEEKLKEIKAQKLRDQSRIEEGSVLHLDAQPTNPRMIYIRRLYWSIHWLFTAPSIIQIILESLDLICITDSVDSKLKKWTNWKPIGIVWDRIDSVVDSSAAVDELIVNWRVIGRFSRFASAFAETSAASTQQDPVAGSRHS